MTITNFLNSKGYNQLEGHCQEIQEQIEDLIKLINLVNKPKIHVMEIGFNMGHSAEIFLSTNNELLLTSFDLGKHYYVNAAKEYIDNTYPNRHTLIIGDSKITLPKFINENNTKFDIIFIDGGNDYDTVKSDLENCFLLADKDTIIILDDTVFKEAWEAGYTIGPTKIWNEYLRENKIIEFNRKEYQPCRGMSWGKCKQNFRKTKKFIFIPVVNNFHLLQKAIDSVPNYLYDEYFIFNNSNTNLEEINKKHFTIINNNPMSFKDTQNKMREYAIENNYDYYSFMHNDGEIVGDAAYRLINNADLLTHQNISWGVIFTHYDVYCAYSTNCVKTIGTWGDEQWPSQKSGYYLDCDYYRRMQKGGFSHNNLENNVLHNECSNTIRNENENRIWNEQRDTVVNHYIHKWGGLPGSETR